METKRTRQSAQRQADILAATLTQFSEQGLAKTTIAAVCQRSGASVGSLYHHFEDREGLLYALYRECFNLCFSELEHAVTQEQTAQGGIIALVHTYLSWIEAHPERGQFIYEASGGYLLTNYEAEILAFKGEFYTTIMGWMQPHIAAGALIALPPWAYDVIIMGPAHEFARRWLAGMRQMPMSTAKTVIAAAIWRAIQPAI